MSITFLGLSPAVRNQNINLHGVYNAEVRTAFRSLKKKSFFYSIFIYMIFRIACNV